MCASSASPELFSAFVYPCSVYMLFIGHQAGSNMYTIDTNQPLTTTGAMNGVAVGTVIGNDAGCFAQFEGANEIVGGRWSVSRPHNAFDNGRQLTRHEATYQLGGCQWFIAVAA